MTVAPQRTAVLKALGRVRRSGAWVREAIGSEILAAGLDGRDAEFARRLATGVIEHLGTLDDLIDRVATHPGRIEPQVRDALRIAAYEIVFMSTPDRAAVNEGCELVRFVRPRAVALANAVLRGIANLAPEFPFGDPESDPLALARLTGHPAWIAEMLVRDLGRDPAMLMLRADAAPAPFSCAANEFLTPFDEVFAALEEAGAKPTAGLVPGSIHCLEPAAALATDLISLGRLIVCDEAAQAVVACAPLAGDPSVVEIAAGRGTKTALMQLSARRGGSEPRIVALELHEFKTEVLRARMTALAIPSVEVVCADASDPEALAGLGTDADLVFVDAPCTGIGTLRRHPEKRWTLRPEDVVDLAGLGRRLLTASSRLVRPGGFVMYSTCTVTHAENGAVIEAFLLDEEGRFQLESLREPVPSGFRRFVAEEGWLQTLPEIDGPDGHFAALMRRVR